MAINKATLAKKVDGKTEYVYPKTTSDMVEYTASQTVEQKIQSIDKDIETVNNRVTISEAELFDIRNPNTDVVGTDVQYTSAGEAVRGQIGTLSDEIAELKINSEQNFNELNNNILDNTEAITQNTADIDMLKVKTLPSINLTSLGVTKIPDLAFCANASIVNVKLHRDTTHIGYAAFQACLNLASVNLSNGKLVSINGVAFADCTRLTSVAIPNSVTYIGYQAFTGCRNLTSITIPSSVTSVGGGNTFQFCSNLTNVTLGDGFNANNLNLSASTKYTADTIVSWLNALADRTGQEQYTLTIGAKNKAKLTDEQLAIATNKNWIIV